MYLKTKVMRLGKHLRGGDTGVKELRWNGFGCLFPLYRGPADFGKHSDDGFHVLKMETGVQTFVCRNAMKCGMLRNCATIDWNWKRCPAIWCWSKCSGRELIIVHPGSSWPFQNALKSHINVFGMSGSLGVNTVWSRTDLNLSSQWFIKDMAMTGNI